MTPTHAPFSAFASAVLACAVAAGVSTAQDDPAKQDIIQTWNGDRFPATIREIGIDALTFETETESARALGWHQVRGVEGPSADAAGPFTDLGEQIWRATARLQRGDSFGAEPLLEAAFERTRGNIGPTPAVVADGLLRCRLRRDARAAAIDSWLDLSANLAAAPARTPGWGVRTTALDTRTGLVPTLPPIWFDSAPARAFADSVEPGAPANAPGLPPDAIRTLYRAAAQFALGDPIDPSATARAAEAASAREGGALVARVVLAQIGGAEVRAQARADLAREMSNHDDRWRAVWASLAIGRSLLREPDPADQRRGVLTLLAIHAADAEVAPYLTAIALADAALACERLGDDHAARTIRDELARQYPNHPVRRLPGLASADVSQHPLTDTTASLRRTPPGAS